MNVGTSHHPTKLRYLLDMSRQYLLAACNDALSRQDLRVVNVSLTAVLVSGNSALVSNIVRMQRIRSVFIFSQATILSLCAIASGALWALWRRMLDVDRNRVW